MAVKLLKIIPRLDGRWTLLRGREVLRIYDTEAEARHGLDEALRKREESRARAQQRELDREALAEAAADRQRVQAARSSELRRDRYSVLLARLEELGIDSDELINFVREEL